MEFFTILLAELVDKKNKRLIIFRIIKKQKLFDSKLFQFIKK